MTVASTTDWGDLLVVAASGREPPPRKELARVAASVERATPEGWDRFVTEMLGGQGLHADDGAVELARGRAGGEDWLLQARPPEREGPPPPGADQRAVDPCLKLATGRRVCARNGSEMESSTNAVAYTHDPIAEGERFPPFTVTQTTLRGAKVRVRTPAGEASADLHPIPGGGGASAAVVFVGRPGIFGCEDRPPQAGPDLGVDVLDPDGGVVACVG